MLTCDDSKTLIVELADLLTLDECSALIQRIEDSSPKLAPVNTAKGTQVRTNVRNNERVVFDDEELAENCLTKPKIICPPNSMVEKLPERMSDSAVTVTNLECDLPLTQMDRLNAMKMKRAFIPILSTSMMNLTAEKQPSSRNREIVVKPVAGDGVLFQHPIIHEGSVVNSGVKYVARTDIMYLK